MDWSFQYHLQGSRSRQLPLATILWADDQLGSERAIPESFGDRYLYRNNSVFRSVRDTFLGLGLGYVGEPASPLWQMYNIAPLLSLQDLIREGVVPYAENTPAVRQIVRRLPLLYLTAAELVTSFRSNYLLHESAHCISDRVVSSQELTGCGSAKELMVLKAIVCESFANVVERVAGALAGGPLHLIFFRLNSYVNPRKDRNLNCALTAFGMRRILQLGFLSYVFFNFRSRAPGEKVVSGFIDGVFGTESLGLTERRLLSSLIESTFLLDTGFTKGTSSQYFRLTGCEREFERLGERRMDIKELDSFGILRLLAPLADLFAGGEDTAIGDTEPGSGVLLETAG
jgi:hypothetical protein